MNTMFLLFGNIYCIVHVLNYNYKSIQCIYSYIRCNIFIFDILPTFSNKIIFHVYIQDCLYMYLLNKPYSFCLHCCSGGLINTCTRMRVTAGEFYSSGHIFTQLGFPEYPCFLECDIYSRFCYVYGLMIL